MIRYAIVGTGRMAARHAEKISRLGDAKLAAVCGTRLEKAEVFSSRFGGKPYTDLDEMLVEIKPDAVYVTTPSRGRVEQVRSIVSRGIHLCIEKPLASSIADANEIIRLVQAAGVVAGVGFHWRSMDTVRQAVELISEAPVTMTVGRFYWTIPMVDWIRKRHLGGGQMFDQTVHMIDLAIHFLGEADHLFASYTQMATLGEMQNWDAYSITTAFKNGSVGNFYSTYALFPESGEEPYLEIIQRNRLIRVTTGRLLVKTPGQEQVYESRDDGMGLTTDFHIAVKKRDQSLIPCPVEDAMRTLRFTLAANCSALSGKVVLLDDFLDFGLDQLEKYDPSSQAKN